MQFHSFIEFVPKIRELNLPGLAQQLTMAPPFRKQLIEQPIDNPKRAAVVCLFHEGIDHETFFISSDEQHILGFIPIRLVFQVVKSTRLTKALGMLQSVSLKRKLVFQQKMLRLSKK